MCEDLRELLRQWAPHNVVIEVPSGKVGGGQRRGAGATLAIYGFAVGAIWATCRAAPCRPLVDEVDERTWTRRKPKLVRQKLIAYEFHEYGTQIAKVAGGDVADAIGIGLWWIGVQREKGLAG
jgi:hypothetical protein